jgi:hypothetical protein
VLLFGQFELRDVSQLRISANRVSTNRSKPLVSVHLLWIRPSHRLFPNHDFYEFKLFGIFRNFDQICDFRPFGHSAFFLRPFELWPLASLQFMLAPTAWCGRPNDSKFSAIWVIWPHFFGHFLRQLNFDLLHFYRFILIRLMWLTSS